VKLVLARKAADPKDTAVAAGEAGVGPQAPVGPQPPKVVLVADAAQDADDQTRPHGQGWHDTWSPHPRSRLAQVGGKLPNGILKKALNLPDDRLRRRHHLGSGSGWQHRQGPFVPADASQYPRSPLPSCLLP
jgi:hypothetical protein